MDEHSYFRFVRIFIELLNQYVSLFLEAPGCIRSCTILIIFCYLSTSRRGWGGSMVTSAMYDRSTRTLNANIVGLLHCVIVIWTLRHPNLSRPESICGFPLGLAQLRFGSSALSQVTSRNPFCCDSHGSSRGRSAKGVVVILVPLPREKIIHTSLRIETR